MSAVKTTDAAFVSPFEAEAACRVAGFLTSRTVIDDQGRMVEDEKGASVSTYPTLMAGSLLGGSAGSLDPAFVHAVVANSFIHLRQLTEACEEGVISRDDLGVVLALGPLVTATNKDHGGIDRAVTGERPAASISDGIAGDEFTIGTAGGRFAKRLELLGFTSDHITDHYHAGRRALIQVGDSIGVRAAMSAAVSGEEDTLWAPIGDMTGVATGPSLISLKPASWCDGTVVLAGLPPARPEWPSPADHGALAVRMASRTRGWEFTPDSFAAYQDQIRTQSASRLSAGGDVPAWTAYVDRMTCPLVKPAAVVIAGQCKIMCDESQRIRLATPAPWANPEWGVVTQAIKTLTDRRFHGEDPPYWSFPDDQRGVLLERLRDQMGTSPSAVAPVPIVMGLLRHPALGPIPEVSAARNASEVEREDNRYTCGPVTVCETTTGTLILSMPPPWTPGWEQAKDLIKATPGRDFLGASKMWSIPVREASGLAERLVASSDEGAPVRQLVDVLRHPELGESFRSQYAGHDEKLAYLRALMAQDVASPDLMRRLGDVLPEHLKPKDFQAVGIEWLEQIGGSGMIADDMGLGKTIQAVCYTLLDTEERFPALVVAPANARSNWVKEYAAWGARAGITIHEADGRLPTTSDLAAMASADVVVANYDILQGWESGIRARGFRTLILDESHYVKNPDTKRSQLIQAIAGNLAGDRSVVALTGTPMPNRAKELTPILRLVRPEAYPEEITFFSDHCIVGREAYGAVWGLKNAVGLHALLIGGRMVEQADAKRPPCLPIMIRRLKDEVLDLPPKTVERLMVHATSSDHLEAHMQDLIENLRRSPSPNHQLAAINRARRFAGALKAPALGQRLIELANDGEPVVGFMHHDEVLTAVSASLRAANIPFGVIAGGVTASKRKKLQEQFQAGEFPVMLCTQAGREALTLTRARRMVIGEREWVPGYEVQAEDRIYRIGQERAVSVEYLHLPHSIDDHLGTVVDLKKRDIDAVMNGLAEDSDESPSIMQQVLASLLGKNAAAR